MSRPVARARRGEGLATERARAALDEAFTAFEPERMISLIRPPNQASIRVAEKLGEGFVERVDVRGNEASLYAIDLETWRTSLRWRAILTFPGVEDSA